VVAGVATTAGAAATAAGSAAATSCANELQANALQRTNSTISDGWDGFFMVAMQSCTRNCWNPQLSQRATRKPLLFKQIVLGASLNRQIDSRHLRVSEWTSSNLHVNHARCWSHLRVDFQSTCRSTCTLPPPNGRSFDTNTTRYRTCSSLSTCDMTQDTRHATPSIWTCLYL
jgi:hypothetical protein